MNVGAQRVAKELVAEIESELSRIGIMFRVFFRVKSEYSIARKISTKNYSPTGKRMQDLIGIRVALYFSDDVSVCVSVLKSRYELVDSTIDRPDSETFCPTRINLVFRLGTLHSESIGNFKNHGLVDNTFEVQVRTILSEGWHEVEHDLRYKCIDEWQPHPDLGRALNGIAASLETSEWSLIQLFDNLAYRHYQDRKWGPMLRNRLRLRTLPNEISEDVCVLLDNDRAIAKKFYKVDRARLIGQMLKGNLSVPLTLDNLFYISNFFFVRSSEIDSIMPDILKDQLYEAASIAGGTTETLHL